MKVSTGNASRDRSLSRVSRPSANSPRSIITVGGREIRTVGLRAAIHVRLDEVHILHDLGTGVEVNMGFMCINARGDISKVLVDISFGLQRIGCEA